MRTMLETLETIRENPDEIPDKLYGICALLPETFDWDSKRIESAFRSWPKFSGLPEHPIPSTDPEFSPRVFYAICSRENMWNPDHPYGALRWELVDHMIKEFSDTEEG